MTSPADPLDLAAIEYAEAELARDEHVGVTVLAEAWKAGHAAGIGEAEGSSNDIRTELRSVREELERTKKLWAMDERTLKGAWELAEEELEEAVRLLRSYRVLLPGVLRSQSDDFLARHPAEPAPEEADGG